MKNALSALAGILIIAGHFPYIYAILRDRNMPPGTPGKTEPSKASWVIWVTLDLITLTAMYAKDALNGQIIGAMISGWMVVTLSFRYGAPGWTKLDKFCIMGAGFGIILWAVSGEAMLALMISVSVVVLGSIPTFVSAWKDPRREDRVAWTLYFLSCVMAVMAIPQWTLANAAQPVAFLSVETVMLYLLYVHQRASL